MIEWKVFDEDNAPEIDRQYLVFTMETIQVASLEKWDTSDNIIWYGSYEGIIFENVTHYAEINLPI